MDDPASFGRLLRERRKTNDLTQEQLAEQVHCSIETIKKLEAGKLRPSKHLAELLATRFALPPTDRETFITAARAAVHGSPRPAPIRRATHRAPAMQRVPEGGVVLAALPTGTVTFLFTDIAGSTRLWEQHPQAMPEALARHDAILRHAIATYDGVVVKTTGDGCHAAFARASDALAAALEAQRALQGEAWGPTGPLRVRMALHSGVTEERDGDYFGPPLNRAARLLAVGHGGQVLLSLATAELVREHLPSDVTLRNLGTHRLRDLGHTEQIFQLVAPDLPVDFPLLQTADARPNNLPTQPTPLIGREPAVAVVRDRVRQGDGRLLTLTGPGGMGKTRLALQVATELLDDFADGVYFVSLAPLRDPALVGPTIAQTLGVTEMGGRPLVEDLNFFLHDKQTLLVLDNFEQVVDAAPLLAELLASAPRLTVLVTSRAVLHLSGEHEFVVPPLALPARHQFPILEQLTQYEAVRLFIARAQAVKADFAVTNENAPAVAEICHRLDGLPLAIELAAVRIKLFPPDALLKRLEQRLWLLMGGPRDVPARQQTLRNAIAWSYDMLDAAEQAIFAGLAVFAGGCTLEAVEAVLADDGRSDAEVSIFIPEDDVLDDVSSLVDQSLLKQAESPGGEPRFVLLEFIREYALERLAASGEAEVVRQRHALYYLSLAEQAEPLLHGAEQWACLDRLGADYDNLRAALAWSQAAHNRAEVGLRLAAALWLFWERGGHLSEGREQLTRMLAHAQATAPTTARVRALFALGILAGIQGDFALAHVHLAESHTLSHTLGYQQGIGYACYGRGFVAWLQGEYATARARHTESLTIFRELGQRWPIALSVHALGDVETNLGAYEHALPLLEESVLLFRELGDQVQYGHALLSLGYAARLQGDNAWAAACYAESLALFQSQKYTWGIAAVYLTLGDQAQAQGDAPQAAANFAESLVRYHEIGHREGISLCLAGLAWAASGQSQPVRAARLFGATAGLRASIGVGEIGPPVERLIYEASEASVRTQLGEAAFAAAWQAGQAMTLEQAITEALSASD